MSRDGYNDDMVKRILAAKAAKPVFVTDDTEELMAWLETIVPESQFADYVTIAPSPHQGEPHE